jgi:hypothetical protein
MMPHPIKRDRSEKIVVKVADIAVDTQVGAGRSWILASMFIGRRTLFETLMRMQAVCGAKRRGWGCGVRLPT